MTARAISSFETKELADTDGVLQGALTKIRPASKIAALKLLGRHFGIWEKDNSESSILNINIVTHENQLDNPRPMIFG